MNPSPAPLSAYVFGPFRLRVRDRILERDGVRVQLTPKVVDTLLVLVENAGRMVSKEDLMSAVWPDVTVVESGLTRNISVLRKALEEGAPDGSYVETIPRRGYRFAAVVTAEREGEAATEPAPEEPARREGRWRWAAIAAAIAGIAVAVWFGSGRSDKPRTVEPRIRIGEYLLYQLAPEQSVRAAEQFEQEVLAHPQSAAAHAGLSIALLQMAALGLRPLPEVAARADAEAKRALDLDTNLHTAHYASGLTKLLLHWRLEEAEKSFARSLELEPASVQTRLGYTQLKFAKGEVEEATRLMEEALKLDPASPLLGARYCQAFYYARDYRRAEAECRKVLDRAPHFALARYYLGLTLGWLGRFDQAQQSLEGINIGPGVVEADEAWLRLREGDRKPAEDVLEKRRALIAQGKLGASTKLMLCAVLGRNDEAYEMIEEVVGDRAFELLTLRVDPRLDGLRNDSRYAGVLRRIGVKPGGLGG